MRYDLDKNSLTYFTVSSGTAVYMLVPWMEKFIWQGGGIYYVSRWAN